MNRYRPLFTCNVRPMSELWQLVLNVLEQRYENNNINSGICAAISALRHAEAINARESANLTMQLSDRFKEKIDSQEFVWSGYYFPLTKEGMHKRIQLVERIILTVKFENYV